MKGPIIIVEDNESGKDFAQMLERRGYLTILYNNGREAVEAIENGLKYKTAIIDLSLPEIDGGEVAKVSKKYNPEALVIITSGIYQKPPGSDIFIEKPIGSSKMRYIVEMIDKSL